ncbi:hypothetical protein, partial [Bacteroides cellulosilyticus]|uniref:hypothetical protein n=1 Tax=Bacteroides cellulosilyticus TaxID=246787 RepID=UPI001C70110F
ICQRTLEFDFLHNLPGGGVPQRGEVVGEREILIYMIHRSFCFTYHPALWAPLLPGGGELG